MRNRPQILGKLIDKTIAIKDDCYIGPDVECYSPSVLETCISNLYVDVTNTCAKKELLIRSSFHSQKNRSYFGKEATEYFYFHYPMTKRGWSGVERYHVLQH